LEAVQLTAAKDLSPEMQEGMELHLRWIEEAKCRAAEAAKTNATIPSADV
jgi:hypothetical protein